MQTAYDPSKEQDKPLRDDYSASNRADCVSRLVCLLTQNSITQCECDFCDGVDRGVCSKYRSFSDLTEDQREAFYRLRRADPELGEDALRMGVLGQIDVDVYDAVRLGAVRRHSLDEYEVAVDTNADTVVMSAEDAGISRAEDSVRQAVRDGLDPVRLMAWRGQKDSSVRQSQYNLPKPRRRGIPVGI